MEDKSDLKKLKESYAIFEKKYSLPSFKELNEDFQIEKLAETETEFVLKEVRRHMLDKFFSYLRFIESLLNPVNAPMFVFAITKVLGNKEKETLGEIYKEIARIEVDLIELDLYYSEKKEAEFIKKYSPIWQKIKKEILDIVDVIRKNLDTEMKKDSKSYFG